MKAKRGRPTGTTKANGYRIAQDAESYWMNRNKTYNTTMKKVVANVPEETGFMTGVIRGIMAFLRPFSKVK